MTLVENIRPKRIEFLEYPYEFSVCTLVNNTEQYRLMLKSFIDAGFSLERCEYLYIDNSQDNRFDAFSAFNIFLQRAQGRYVIICHQDIELIYDKIDVLEKRIRELDEIDPRWALIGNAGGINLKYKSMKITHGVPPVYRQSGKYYPQKVQTLDENFILVKREANLAVSSDLTGFHFYGADICIIAYMLGFSAYIIDFHLYHKSRGNKDESFYNMKRMFQRKYQKALGGRFLQTVTKQRLYISGSRFANLIFNAPFVLSILRKYYKLRLFIKGSY